MRILHNGVRLRNVAAAAPRALLLAPRTLLASHPLACGAAALRCVAHSASGVRGSGLNRAAARSQRTRAGGRERERRVGAGQRWWQHGNQLASSIAARRDSRRHDWTTAALLRQTLQLAGTSTAARRWDSPWGLCLRPTATARRRDAQLQPSPWKRRCARELQPALHAALRCAKRLQPGRPMLG